MLIASSVLALQGVLSVSGAEGAAGAAPQPGGAGAPKLGDMKVGRILFLGNSITLHGPSTAVSWDGNWGMAASAAEKDYVHLVSKGIAAAAGSAPEVMAENIATFERQYGTFDVGAALKKPLDFKADVLVLCIGENVAALKTAEAQTEFRTRLTALLNAFKESSQPRLFVRSCFWPDPVKDGILKAVCAELGGTYVDISALSKDEHNYARSERSFKHAGVANHPGDQGMQAIADAILKAMTGTK
ncbi:MAG: hypothetical protein A3K19_08320 [Lentisphaerae bacterium RIFOXYB12_FULL_65_16]|nr:MAG: hypothetical protein A3K18_00320 [Lentisphaerae bacterium RIFOXYA12_64_32]OGV89874.1 MAG: hypothetical protein A3K19_08320 [Lentisphaerae bacterium RIFOXYB12_FULL_65_16]